MNRARQLAEAIESCLKCDLPNQTEILIVDNASSDNTEQVVRDLREKYGANIEYIHLVENIGAGRARNKAMEYATGEYMYFLDDDAIVSDKNPNFFKEGINILEQNTNIGTLTTQIYDTAWKCNRLNESNRLISDGLYECFMPCGGSHFFKRSRFINPINFLQKYGYEEMLLGIQAYNKGLLNVYSSKLLVIHKPLVNKWVIKDNKEHFINDIASQYAIKKSVYPWVCKPILWIMYQLRYLRHLRGSGLKAEGTIIIDNLRSINQTIRTKRINMSVFLRLLKQNGISIL